MMDIPATGMQRGNWTLIAAIAGQDNVWLCRCVCGRHLPLKITRLRRRPPRSCGCHFWDFWEDDPPPVSYNNIRVWRTPYKKMLADYEGVIDERWLGREGYRRWLRDVSPIRPKPWRIALRRGFDVLSRSTFVWRDERRDIIRRRIGELTVLRVFEPAEHGFYVCRCVCGREVVRSYEYLMRFGEKSACCSRCVPRAYDSGRLTIRHASDLCGASSMFLKKFVVRGNKIEEAMAGWEVQKKRIPIEIDRAIRKRKCKLKIKSVDTVRNSSKMSLNGSGIFSTNPRGTVVGGHAMTTENRLWILGAGDPEMQAIETLLRECGETVAYAVDAGGKRVHPGNAYRAVGRAGEPEGLRPDTIYMIECDGVSGDIDAALGICPEIVHVDHHRPGDPGYGKPSAEFLSASSIGQVVAILTAGRDENCGYAAGLGMHEREIFHAAAADHCLAAAYRGECPGVDPDELMQWRVKSRAEFQKRDPSEILADIKYAREVLREAYAGGYCPEQDCNAGSRSPSDWACSTCGGRGWIASRTVGGLPDVADMRGIHVPELPEASARENICFVADGLPGPDGRVKIVCQSGSPEQIRAFMEEWCPGNGLVDVYGDPARGFAGAYQLPATA